MKLADIIILNEQPGNKENETFRRAPSVGDVGDKMTTAQAAKVLGTSPSDIRQKISGTGQKKVLSKVKGPVEGRRDNFLDASEVKALKDKKNKKDARSRNEKGNEKDE